MSHGHPESQPDAWYPDASAGERREMDEHLGGDDARPPGPTASRSDAPGSEALRRRDPLRPAPQSDTRSAGTPVRAEDRDLPRAPSAGPPARSRCRTATPRRNQAPGARYCGGCRETSSRAGDSAGAGGETAQAVGYNPDSIGCVATNVGRPRKIPGESCCQACASQHTRSAGGFTESGTTRTVAEGDFSGIGRPGGEQPLRGVCLLQILEEETWTRKLACGGFD